MSEDRQTRGESNRNPGNVVWNAKIAWLGQVPEFERTDKHFCQFDDDVHGIRALCKILRNYQRLDGCRTLTDVITRWAPPSENDTAAYIADVSQRSGISADSAIDFDRSGELAAVSKAIIHHENGRCIYGDDVIGAAVKMALA